MASSSLMSGKITLHSTSKIPLSERFKMVQQTALIKKNIEPMVRPQRATVKPSTHGSKKNRMLAASLANKPSVLAALKIKKKSIKQRLGATQTRFSSAALINRSARKPKRNINERLQIAPKPGGNSRRPKLNRNNFVGATKVVPKNVRRVNRRSGGAVSSADNIVKRRPLNSRFNNSIINNKSVNPVNRQQRQRNNNNNTVARRGQQRLNQQMKNRKLTTSNNFKSNPRNQTTRQRNFKQGRRNNQGKPEQGVRSRGFNQGQRNTNVKKRFQNRKPNRQNQRRNPDKNSLDKDLDAYMAKTKTQLDADLDAYMAGTCN